MRLLLLLDPMVQHFERGRLHAYDDGLAFACRNRTWSLPWNHSSLHEAVISEMQAEVKLRGSLRLQPAIAVEISQRYGRPWHFVYRSTLLTILYLHDCGVLPSCSHTAHEAPFTLATRQRPPVGGRCYIVHRSFWRLSPKGRRLRCMSRQCSSSSRNPSSFAMNEERLILEARRRRSEKACEFRFGNHVSEGRGATLIRSVAPTGVKT